MRSRVRSSRKRSPASTSTPSAKTPAWPSAKRSWRVPGRHFGAFLASMCQLCAVERPQLTLAHEETASGCAAVVVVVQGVVAEGIVVEGVVPPVARARPLPRRPHPSRAQRQPACRSLPGTGRRRNPASAHALRGTGGLVLFSPRVTHLATDQRTIARQTPDSAPPVSLHVPYMMPQPEPRRV